MAAEGAPVLGPYEGDLISACLENLSWPLQPQIVGYAFVEGAQWFWIHALVSFTIRTVYTLGT